MRYERAAVSREAVKLCQPIRTLSFVRLGTVTSGLQVCSFPWDVLCSQAAGAEPTTLAASVLPARWRPCHYAIVFISGHILSAEMTSGTGNLEPKAKLTGQGNLSWNRFLKTSVHSHCKAFPLQAPVTVKSTGLYEAHQSWGAAEWPFLYLARLAEQMAPCWELQALANNYQISSVLSSSWVWDYWLNLEWPLHNGHDEQSCSWAPGQWDWADPFQVQTVL